MGAGGWAVEKEGKFRDSGALHYTVPTIFQKKKKSSRIVLNTFPDQAISSGGILFFWVLTLLPTPKTAKNSNKKQNINLLKQNKEFIS